MKVVPNQFPTITQPYRLAIIGASPSATDEQTGVPFSGTGGNLLNNILAKFGCLRGACFLGNVSQENLPWMGEKKEGKKAAKFNLATPAIASGLAQLKSDLDEFNPNCVVLLGALPLFASGETRLSLSEARGYLFQSRDNFSPFFNRKCIPTYSPESIFKTYSNLPIFRFDLKRAYTEAFDPTLEWTPAREVVINASPAFICEYLHIIQQRKEPICFDIEGYPDIGISCCSVAISPTYTVSIHFPFYELPDQVRIFRALRDMLMDPSVPKIMQNGMYDQFAVMWKWKFPIRGYCHDTMFSGWELMAELPKGLGFLASMRCRVPSFKWMRSDEKNEAAGLFLSTEEKLRYNGLDTLYTYEIHNSHMAELSGTSLTHYNFNMRLIPMFSYMMRRGILYDKPASLQRLAVVESQLSEIRDMLEATTGTRLNPGSPKQMNDVFYKKLGFVPQYQIEHGRKTSRLTCDNEALLNLRRKSTHPAIEQVLKWRAFNEIRKQLSLVCEDDSRMRCTYNHVGTETGRLTCSGTNLDIQPDKAKRKGSGGNLQTTTKILRDLYLADPGLYLNQNDLEGADGWTVAAHCASRGDETMLLDYRAGIKPAKVIALMYMQHTGQLTTTSTKINSLSRPELHHLASITQIPEWLYFTAKRAQHATNYGVKKRTMSIQILRDSYKLTGTPIVVTESTCQLFQQLYLMRYPGVLYWQNATKVQLETKGYIVSASGQVRHFLGRRTDDSTLKEALAHEPQANTTFATNRAMLSIWEDSENLLPAGSPRIFRYEPLHQVHDALIGQFHPDDLEWVRKKKDQWFGEPLIIAGIPITIPFAGGYGLSWGGCEEKHPHYRGKL